MNSKKRYIKKLTFLAVIVFVFSIFTTVFVPDKTEAGELTFRSIRLGSSFPAPENTTHTFSFRTTTDATTVGSVLFQYCSNSPLFVDPCTAPAGLDVSGAGLLNESGLTGFSVSGLSDPSNLIITRAPQAETPVTATFLFDNIINPSTPNEVDYVRIHVYDGPNATGNLMDSGSVVFVVDDRFNVSAFVPPYLTFCVGVTVALNCSSASGFLADFGEFSEFSATTATTQMSVSTNDPNGYNVFINGQTLTSGANIIPNLTTQTASVTGTSQFGINLRANSNPSVGANNEVGPVGNGVVAPNYNTPNLFRFVPGEVVARSTRSTGFNRYTVSYIVNVDEDQNPGVYASTLTYTAVATF